MYTLSELHEKLEELASGSEVYTIKRLKQKLMDYYKDFIFFAEIEERHNVVCFRNMAKFIVNEKWYWERKDTLKDEYERIVKTAAQLIQTVPRTVPSSMACHEFSP